MITKEDARVFIDKDVEFRYTKSTEPNKHGKVLAVQHGRHVCIDSRRKRFEFIPGAGKDWLLVLIFSDKIEKRFDLTYIEQLRLAQSPQEKAAEVLEMGVRRYSTGWDK